MIKIFLPKVFGLCLAIILSWTTTVAQVESGADGYAYSPQYGNFDNFTAKGDLLIQIASGAIAKSVLPGVRIAYSPLNKIGVGVNYFSFANSTSQIEQQQTKVQILSGDIFYYGAFNSKEDSKWTTQWRVGAGYGNGTFSREYFETFTGNANLGIQRYILETGVLIKGKNAGFGVGIRGKYYNFSNNVGFGEIPIRQIEKLDYLVSVAPEFLIDLNTRFEFGGDLGRFFLSLDTTLNNFKNENNLISSLIDKESIHLGYYFLISKAINKNKIEI